MESRQKNMPAVASCSVCAVLVLVGLIRMLSYSLGIPGEIVRQSVAGFLGYNPESLLSAQFFKILATPSVVALIYFFFRWRNAGASSHLRANSFGSTHKLDFDSPILRGILTSVITVHWLAMEWWKFNTEGFYPWSELESPTLNIIVLIVGQGLAFWGMKYLSFEPISKPPAPSRALHN